MAILLTNSVAVSGLNVTIEKLKLNYSSIDAIESGIRIVESDPKAGWVGYGGHPNLLGVVELDAGIMDGSNLHAGAVGALEGYKHPISVARKVMENLPNVFLVGRGAAKFALDCKAEAGYNLSDEAEKCWKEWLGKNLMTKESVSWLSLIHI